MVTEEEAEEQLTAELDMEVEEDRDKKGQKGGEELKGHWDPLSYSLRMQSRA